MTKDNFKGFIPKQGIEERWGILDSIVYLSFIQPKTQKEAVRLVYNKSYEDVNMRPFREARKKLTNQGYLKHDGSMRNATFTSSMKAFTEQVESNIEDICGEELTENEINEIKEALHVITDSDWFRSFFQEEYLESMYGLGRNARGRLDYVRPGEYSLKVMGQVIHDVWGIGHAPDGVIENDFELTDLADYDDFEKFQEEHSGFFLQKLESRFGEELTKEEVVAIISEGHGITDDMKWETTLLNNLVYDSELLFKLPSIDHKIMRSIPGRDHSYYDQRTCDIAEKLKATYVLDDGAFLTNRRVSGQINKHPALEQIKKDEKVRDVLSEEEFRELESVFRDIVHADSLEELKSFDISELKDIAERLDLTEDKKEILLNSAMNR